jgi:hypothetical protein
MAGEVLARESPASAVLDLHRSRGRALAEHVVRRPTPKTLVRPVPMIPGEPGVKTPLDELRREPEDDPRAEALALQRSPEPFETRRAFRGADRAVAAPDLPRAEETGEALGGELPSVP